MVKSTRHYPKERYRTNRRQAKNNLIKQSRSAITHKNVRRHTKQRNYRR